MKVVFNRRIPEFKIEDKVPFPREKNLKYLDLENIDNITKVCQVPYSNQLFPNLPITD